MDKDINKLMEYIVCLLIDLIKEKEKKNEKKTDLDLFSGGAALPVLLFGGGASSVRGGSGRGDGGAACRYGSGESLYRSAR